MGRRKQTCCGTMVDRFNSIDMFGAHINFNINGKPKYNSCLGSCTTILIFVLVVFYGLYQTEKALVATHVPIISTQIREGFFTEKRELYQKEGDFAFAVAISSTTGFTGQSASNFRQYGSF